MEMTGNSNFDQIEKIRTYGFLEGGGEMGKVIREYNWAETSIGTPDTWPQSLRTTLSIILNSKFPMFLFWGTDHICFYNDAYRPSLGNEGKHPKALGEPGEIVWKEIWPVIKPMIDQVLSGGEATLNENQLIPIYRNGKMEDVYWTFCYSAVKDETGKPSGVFVTCTETTGNVVSLQESKDQLKFAVEAAELGVWNLNFDTNKFKLNDTLKEWFGLTTEDLDKNGEVELSVALNAIAEKDRQRVSDTIQYALQPSSEGYYDIEYTIKHLITKKERIVRAKGRTRFNNEGIPVGINGTILDVSKESLSKKELEESEARFRSLIEEAPVATCLFTGRDMKVEVANDIMIAYWGKGKSVMGKPLIEALPELQDQPFLKILEEVYTTGIAYEAKAAPAKLEVGGVEDVYYFDFTYKPLRNSIGEVYGIMDMAVDVTEQVVARQRLEESEERFRIMADATPNIVWALNPDSSVKYVNQFTLDFLGVTFEKFISDNWIPYVHPEDLDSTMQKVTEAIRERKIYSIEQRLLRYDGEYRWLLTQGGPSYFPNGELYGYVGSSIDITELKETEKDLESKNKQLIKINNDLDNFIYTASHDLKAPISNIEGIIISLKDTFISDNTAISDDAQILLQMVNKSIERFKNTILDLTQISKIQRLDEEDLNEINCLEIIEDVKLSLYDAIISSGAKIEVDVRNCNSLRFSGKNFKSIIYNLLSNAIKFRHIDHSLEIKIKTEKVKDYLLLTIKDNGLGIDPSNQSKVFKMFKRFHNHVEGTGIGLYIVKRILDNAGGKIEVESEEGKGTTFKVYFKI